MPSFGREILAAFSEKPVTTPMLAVTGGKGGTGKTVVAVNLAVALHKLGYRVLLVDADADSPSTRQVLGAKPGPEEPVMAFRPVIAAEKCTGCGRCAEACRAHALIQVGEKPPLLFEHLCSSCKACLLVCPVDAVEEGSREVGRLILCRHDGVTLIVGELRPTERHSTAVVVAAKERAYQEAAANTYDVIIIDTAPGAHCNVVQALRGSDAALAVTEPTPLGAYDLDLILKLTSLLGIRADIVLNKADLPGARPDDIIEIAKRYSASMEGEVPFDKDLFRCYTAGKPVVTELPESPPAKSLMELAKRTEQTIARVKGSPHPSHEPSSE